MKIDQFLEIQNSLGITNSILNKSSKINEKLLDGLKLVFEQSKNISDRKNVKCNAIILKQPDVNSLNIQMSGSTEQNTKYCYDNLVFFTDAQKTTGLQLKKESDSYKITLPETTDKSSSVTTTATTDSITTSSSSSREAEIEKIVYDTASNQAKKGVAESNQTKKILQEQINRMKKIMYR